MIGIILIICCILLLCLLGTRYSLLQIILGLTVIVSIVLILFNIGSYGSAKEDIKAKQIKIIEQYELSDKTDNDWQQTVSMIKQTNEDAGNIDNQKTKYKFLDVVYFVGSICGTHTEDYTVYISENKIIFPEHYEMPNVVKGTSQETTEPTTKVTYEETEINGTKYQLVPLA